MLLNRISLRVATAVGSAAMVAGATFAVSAFADDTGEPDTTPAAARPTPAADEPEEPFFPETDQTSPEEREAQLAEAQDRREQALTAAFAQGTGSVEEEEKEEEPEESDGGSGSAPAPTGDPKDIARAMLADFGWGEDQFSGCLEPLWEKESNWNPSAQNPSSGAYGIPQALPGDKMATAGSDWRTNPATQIEWGLGYIEDRYGSPCEAWAHSQANGWY
ncbi:transglycosylase SLT domain-containing protein [Marinactinospora rubrisoli]|uniref:Transglycosylase SLT domain-containing protein n=1 Tax=Marinactinospora rubrisoli TaxID=2715399 RepID=A0ABW2KCJ7_9ACTN